MNLGKGGGGINETLAFVIDNVHLKEDQGHTCIVIYLDLAEAFVIKY